jgi:hypothetical protein
MSRWAAPAAEEEALEAAELAEPAHDGSARTAAARGSQRDDRANAQRAGSQDRRLVWLEPEPELAVEFEFEFEVEFEFEFEFAVEFELALARPQRRQELAPIPTQKQPRRCSGSQSC